jgi:hypothetical protein
VILSISTIRYMRADRIRCIYRTIEQTVLKVFDTHLSVLDRLHTLENPDSATRTIYAWIC